ncbi:MAG: hypothetical protein WBF58_06100 [Xanthobacteraceae bacterium]
MIKWARKEIQNRALGELKGAGVIGIRYMELAKRIHAAAPETPFNSIVGALHDLSLKDEEIVRPSRGLWVLKKYWEKEGGDSKKNQISQETASAIVEIQPKNYNEETYYESFASGY